MFQNMTERQTKGPEILGEVLNRIAGKLKAGEELEWRTESANEFADAPKSAGARGPVDDVPTVGRPAIVAKDAERE